MMNMGRDAVLNNDAMEAAAMLVIASPTAMRPDAGASSVPSAWKTGAVQTTS